MTTGATRTDRVRRRDGWAVDVGGPLAGRLLGDSIRPAAPRGGKMAFVQVIEVTTTKVPEIEELMNEWLAATEGRRSARRSLLTRDRDRADTYVQVVEFPSYEAAMANSALP